jgi:hypothetical protein
VKGHEVLLEDVDVADKVVAVVHGRVVTLLILVSKHVLLERVVSSGQYS